MHNIKLTKQLPFRNMKLKFNHRTGCKWFIHGPERRKDNQLLSLEHSCWLYLVHYVQFV